MEGLGARVIIPTEEYSNVPKEVLLEHAYGKMTHMIADRLMERKEEFIEEHKLGEYSKYGFSQNKEHSLEAKLYLLSAEEYAHYLRMKRYYESLPFETLTRQHF